MTDHKLLKCKIFCLGSYKTLELKINNFINEEKCDVKDIKINIRESSQQEYYWAVILYQ